MATIPKPLGRRVPTDWEHVEKYPLTAVPFEEAVPTPRPVVLGINWYKEFDQPRLFAQRYWVARTGKLTTIRGGHCVCMPHRLTRDKAFWHVFYDQGREGACVGFGCSRAMSLLNQKAYYARWLWDKAKATDDWPETNPGDDEGTSVRAALDILKEQGHVAWNRSYAGEDYVKRDEHLGQATEGISVYRWAASAQEVLDVLANPLYVRVGGIPFLNSWGKSYPYRTWMTLEVLDRLIQEEGEVGVITDL